MLNTTRAHSKTRRVKSITERSCKVLHCSSGQVFWNTKLSSSAPTNTYRPSVSHAYEKRNYALLPHAIKAIVRTIQTIVSACDIMHRHLRIRRNFRNSLRQSKPASPWNNLRHYRLHRFLIATGGATTIYAHNHIWTDNHKSTHICFY